MIYLYIPGDGETLSPWWIPSIHCSSLSLLPIQFRNHVGVHHIYSLLPTPQRGLRKGKIRLIYVTKSFHLIKEYYNFNDFICWTIQKTILALAQVNQYITYIYRCIITPPQLCRKCFPLWNADGKTWIIYQRCPSSYKFV